MRLGKPLFRSLPKLSVQSWLPLTQNVSLPHLFLSSAEGSRSIPLVASSQLMGAQTGAGFASGHWMAPRQNIGAHLPFGVVACSPRRITTTPNDTEGPVAIDYSALLEENKFSKLAEETLEELQQRIEEWGEDLDLDGFDAEYSQGVLTVKLGPHGTYVLNKQTPNRQIWLSSPVSGPARFDWDKKYKHWVYRRTKAELRSQLQSELTKLLGSAIALH